MGAAPHVADRFALAPQGGSSIISIHAPRVGSDYQDCDSRWSANWRRQYADVLKSADLVKVISPTYSMASFQKRDEWMVDHASRVIAVYDGVSGGTKNTIDYAMRCNVEVEYA